MSKDGGPAFPHTVMQYHTGESGMSLRDYFAAAALQAVVGASFCKAYEEEIDPSAISESWVKLAFRFADAMLVERDK